MTAGPAARGLPKTLRNLVADPETAWSCGSFGAIAEFARVSSDRARVSKDGLSVHTARGALRIETLSQVRPVAYELPSSDPDLWQHGMALCLPKAACAMGRRTVFTELGPDRDAVRRQDRAAILFDLGLGVLQADTCIRTADPAAIAILRAGQGRSLLEPGNPLMREILRIGPHRVFRCRFGRVEVYQPIPAPTEKSPEGPHTHVLPRLLAHGRTHAATIPIPKGWVPCMTVFPPNPARDGSGHRKPFDLEQHVAFQGLIGRFGDPGLVAIKQAVMSEVGSAAGWNAMTRAERTAARVGERQRAYLAAKARGEAFGDGPKRGRLGPSLEEAAGRRE